MRDLRTLIRHALPLPGGPPVCEVGGCFEIPFAATGVRLRVIASAVHPWDHVSVSLKHRCPNWPEMSHIKALFFEDDECAMQLHVPVEDHVSTHPYCLHLWRPHDVEIPRPPSMMVGVKGMTMEQAKALTPAQRMALIESSTAAIEGGAP